MVNCSVDGCKSRSEKKMEGISFHRFPKDNDMKDKWIQAIGKKTKWEPTINSTVCNLHFEDRYIDKRSKRTIITADGIPTIFENLFQKRAKPSTSTKTEPTIFPTDSPKMRKLRIKLHNANIKLDVLHKKVRCLQQLNRRQRLKLAIQRKVLIALGHDNPTIGAMCKFILLKKLKSAETKKISSM